MKEINIKIRIDDKGSRLASITHIKGFKSKIEMHLELIGVFNWLLNKELNKINTKGKIIENGDISCFFETYSRRKTQK